MMEASACGGLDVYFVDPRSLRDSRRERQSGRLEYSGEAESQLNVVIV